MTRHNKVSLAIGILFVFTTILSPLAGRVTAEPDADIPLYGVFETKITNNKSYSNPYNYQVIELQASFNSPTGKQYSFFGFYDGDGNGGLTGNVWRLRFMPNENGNWTYTYTWTDGTAGGSGTFKVVDTGNPGPLKVASDRSWYFQNARGNPFNFRGYSLHRYMHWKYGRGINSSAAWADLQDKIRTKVAGRNYNAVMMAWPVFTRGGEGFNNNIPGHHFWQQNGSDIDFTRFHIPQWRLVEQTIKVAGEKKVYVFPFVGLVDQYTPRPNDAQMNIYLRYMAARLGPYWNNFGYSATWEYQDIWSHTKANTVMGTLHNNLKVLPAHPLLSIHDHANNSFTGWMDFAMRQRGATTVFEGNCRPCGQHGGTGSEFVNKPIIGSEDIWEMAESSDMPKTGSQARRGAWGLLLAGVMPVYLEETGSSGSFNGEGEPYIRLAYDFFYSNKTRYREYVQMNALVSSSSRQIASGIAGQEYMVYDEDGGTLKIDLSGASSSSTFTVLWYNPKTGAEQSGDNISGGASRTLNSPFSSDTVLLLRKVNASPTPTKTPTTPPPTATSTPVTPPPTATGTIVPTQTGQPPATATPGPGATEPPPPPTPTATPGSGGGGGIGSTIRLNFQPGASQAPTGFFADDGSVFADHGNGLIYGWNSDNRENTRERNAPNSPDDMHDTFIHMQKNGYFNWEMALPNGKYEVKVIAGDPKHTDSVYKINVEGSVAIDGVPSTESYWLSGVVVVTVSDGYLTISNEPGAENNKLNFIEITAIKPPSSPGFTLYLPSIISP